MLKQYILRLLFEQSVRSFWGSFFSLNLTIFRKFVKQQEMLEVAFMFNLRIDCDVLPQKRNPRAQLCDFVRLYINIIFLVIEGQIWELHYFKLEFRVQLIQFNDHYSANNSMFIVKREEKLIIPKTYQFSLGQSFVINGVLLAFDQCDILNNQSSGDLELFIHTLFTLVYLS